MSQANTGKNLRLPTQLSAPVFTPFTLLLIRHGERADGVSSHPWNTHRSPRRFDPPLTTLGNSQAVAAANALIQDNIQCSVVYSSPLTRCLETAAPLAVALNVPVHVVYSLAKSCKYFRFSSSHNCSPQVPDPQQAADILRGINPLARLSNYTHDDGLSCSHAIQTLIGRTVADAPKHDSRWVTVVSGHCESQRELAKYAGHRLTPLPFCGRATFELSAFNDRQNSRSWSLVETPLQHKQRLNRREQE